MKQSSPPPAAMLRRETLGRDALASVVVFLVALPLCMGIAIASGLPPERGIVTGIVGGLLVGFIAGSPLQVSGPAAGLAVICLELVNKWGLATFGVIVLLAGVLQLAAGLFKLGRWFRATSPAVIYGMLAGIGVLIFGSQFHTMVDDTPRGGGLANLLSIPEAIHKGLLPVEGTSHHFAAYIGVLTISAILLWNRFRPAKLRAVPGALVAVVLASGVAAIFGLPIRFVDIPASLASTVALPTAETLWQLLDPALFLAALGVAAVASAETLLCATAVDRMHDGPRTDYDRELAAQGLGNTICGALGALPMTGVIVRSSANVEAGAKTRLSAILHGAWLLLLVAAFPVVLRLIPTSALAAVLVYTGWKLVNPAAVRKLREYGRGEVVVYGATLGTIVVTDLLTGVITGLVLSALKLLYTFSHLDIRREDGDTATVLHLEGAATFLRLPALASALEEVPRHRELHLQFGELAHIDHACLELIADWEKEAERAGGRLVIDWDEMHARYARRPPRLTELKVPPQAPPPEPLDGGVRSTP